MEPAVSENQNEAIQSLWERHCLWSSAADHLKANVVRFRTLALALGIAGAFFQTLGATLSSSTAGIAATMVGAVALVLVPIITLNFLSKEQVESWLRARSVSEGIKSEIFRFRAQQADHGADDLTQLLSRCRKIEVWADSLATELARATPLKKPAPGTLAADAYIKQRVEGQISSYYRAQARRNARFSDWSRWTTITLACFAAAFGAVATALKVQTNPTTGLGAWIAVLTTLGASVTAHAAANRFTENARSYFATARQLEDLRDEWVAKGRPVDRDAWAAFVAACEETISAENRAWRAKMDPEERKP